MDNLDYRVRQAVRHFWRTRKRQAQKQGRITGKKDYGSRSAVTGGKQIDGFIRLMSDLLAESGVSKKNVHLEKKQVVLPGWFRPTKEWDIIAVVDGVLLAVVEFKSQVGSFGNNFNNRTEEAIGNATDILTAYREGAFKGSPRPWTGYFMLLEDALLRARLSGFKSRTFRCLMNLEVHHMPIGIAYYVKDLCVSACMTGPVFCCQEVSTGFKVNITSRRRKSASIISRRR